jgi:hypothetical protein
MPRDAIFLQRRKKPGPVRGPVSVCRRGGRQPLPEGNMLRTGDSGTIQSVQQQARSMWGAFLSGNAARRMTAMPNRECSNEQILRGPDCQTPADILAL